MFLELIGKAQDVKEKYVYLTEECNLSCVFCWQDHNKKTNNSAILQTLNNIFTEKVDVPTLYNVMGGEIFADFIEDFVIEKFYNKDNNENKTFNWLTNLIINIDRFEQFISNAPSNYIWSTSYDPCGRFTSVQKQEFINNVFYLKSKNIIPHTISIVLTNQNIDAILNGDDVFHMLYQADFKIFFDFLSPIENNFSALFPTESTIEKFFKFLIEYYPKCGPINEWHALIPQKASCRNSQIIGFDNINTNCGNVQINTNKKLIPLVDLGSYNLQVSYIQKRNCFSCKFFDVCPLGCFLNHQTDGYMDLPEGECGYRNVLNFIETRNNNNK